MNILENTFLPDNYEVPGGNGGRFMRLKTGENRFRKLANSTPRGAITGYVVWVEEYGNRKAKRYRTLEEIPQEYLKSGDKPKHFWAMKVIDWSDRQIKVLELTQVTIQKDILKLTQNAKWGNPEGYDMNVTKTGEGKDTRYSTMPEPKSELDEDIVELDKNTPCNLNALFDGGDPFSA